MPVTLADNLEKLNRHVSSDGLCNHIGGQDLPSTDSKTFDNICPADGSMIGPVAAGDKADIDEAARAAREAFPAWRDLAGAQRRDILHAVADAIEAQAEKISLVESHDSGQPVRFTAKAALRGAENFRFFADRAPGARDGQVLPSPTLLNTTTRVPIGPVGVITPWNVPFMLATWKIAPALAAGCTVVHKPAELAPLTAWFLVNTAEEAGLPPGVLNCVNGLGETAGAALTQHPAIRAIGFVGESATGSRIMAQAAPTLKRVHFELGGKNPVLVFPDADLERALDAVVFMIYSNNGERCTSSSRLLVHDDIADDFIAEVGKRVAALKVGHPLDPATEIGPLISAGHHAKVTGHVAAAREAGATVIAGDGGPGDGGYYAPPVLVTDATPDMAIAREEVFGPVLTALRFQDTDAALALANDTPYGLAAYVWTADITRALRCADRLEAGMVWVNSENVRHLPTPFGGTKASGIGRDGGDWSFEFFMEQKMVAFATGRHAIPQLGRA